MCDEISYTDEAKLHSKVDDDSGETAIFYFYESYFFNGKPLIQTTRRLTVGEWSAFDMGAALECFYKFTGKIPSSYIEFIKTEWIINNDGDYFNLSNGFKENTKKFISFISSNCAFNTPEDYIKDFTERYDEYGLHLLPGIMKSVFDQIETG